VHRGNKIRKDVVAIEQSKLLKVKQLITFTL